MLFNAKHFTVITGLGKGSFSQNAFDNSLQDAGVGNYNLIKVSSILPPKCKKSNVIDVEDGSLLPIAYSHLSSKRKGCEITAAIGVGIPIDNNSVGVIMEFADYTNSSEAECVVRQMVEEAMSNRGIRIKEIIIRSSSTIVKECDCVFAAIALW